MISDLNIRAELPGDEAAIAAVVAAAFAASEHGDNGEAEIVSRLRSSGALAISLLAQRQAVLGHASFSPVSIEGGALTWFGLGPVAVLPAHQGQRIGTMLIERGIDILCKQGAAGCVVLGNPAYYGRFGFVHDPALRYPGPPSKAFQRLVLSGSAPSGVVRYNPAFG